LSFSGILNENAAANKKFEIKQQEQEFLPGSQMFDGTQRCRRTTPFSRQKQLPRALHHW